MVQCPSNTVVNTKDPHTGLEAGATSGQGGAASLYSGGGLCALYTRVSATRVSTQCGTCVVCTLYTRVSCTCLHAVWDGTCGNQNLPPLNRIVGGYPTVEYEFPWMAAVLRTCDSSYCHICGATIISEVSTS